MANEIERKFRVDPTWHPPGEGTAFEQGYLNTAPERTVRVRIEGDRAKLTIKGASAGISRPEFEYDIPLDDARQLLGLCEPSVVTKRRHVVEHAGKEWEVDVFGGDNEGLIVAELELAAEHETFERPPWLRDEVSDDRRYYNSQLAKNPYRSWDQR
ncbi:MAG TPA: CYTH domain-containing protein [Kofleriaceae bacterium]|nr:CYTH domain-containing protein [Kofleriaceae bacterium]